VRRQQLVVGSNRAVDAAVVRQPVLAHVHAVIDEASGRRRSPSPTPWTAARTPSPSAACSVDCR
jgi:hypothetical protein